MTEHTDRPRRTARPTAEIEPMVPRMPRTPYRADGGRERERTLERPPSTDHTRSADRHREEIEPLVPRLD